MAVDSAGKVRVRFPPSPTGFLHLGGARTALFNWLYARKNKGVFVFRIEDSDKERSKQEYEEQIIESLNWLSLDWDEGIGKEKDGLQYRQSERTDIYKKYLEKLLAEKKAYWCYCSKDDLEAERQLAIAEDRPPKYSGRCRHLAEPPQDKAPQVIRLKVPDEKIEFHDLIRGKVSTDMGLLGDIVIAKNLEEALYNFAVVIDDHDMGITHVIRGEDHISNTPKQVLIQKYLGFTVPEYGHLPLVLNPDRSKLSKRYADVNVLSYREQGYLPEALLNYLALLGWHPQDDREVFTLAELAEEFDMSRVQKSGAIWNDEKLAWLNKEHLKRLSLEELEKALTPFWGETARHSPQELRRGALRAVRERLHLLSEITGLTDFFFETPDYDSQILVWKKGSAAEARGVLAALAEIFENLADIDAETLPAILEPLTEKYGKGNVLWPLRTALSGLEASPDPFSIAAVIGPAESAKRIKKALVKLEKE